MSKMEKVRIVSGAFFSPKIHVVKNKHATCIGIRIETYCYKRPWLEDIQKKRSNVKITCEECKELSNKH